MRRTFSSVPIVGVVLASVVIASDTGRASADPTPPGAAACTALAAATFTPAATITTIYDAGSASQPAHCVVRGSAAPRTGADGKPYETRFELRLPTSWSGRFLYQGGGGNDGMVAPAVGRNTGSFPDTGLQRGFAVVTTDAGHQGATAEFGLDPVARVDHAYAAHERTATIAFAIVSRYYGRAPDSQVLRRLLGRRTAGHDVRAAIPGVLRRHRHLRAGDERIERRDDCRGLGHADVSVDRASRCERAARAQPRVQRRRPGARRARHHRGVRCRRRRDRRNGPASRGVPFRSEASAVRRREGCELPDVRSRSPRSSGRSAGPRDSSGRALYVGQAWDPGIAAPGWRQWKLGSSQTGTPNAANTTLMAGALAHEFFTPPDPAFAITRFDFDRDPGTDGGILRGLRHLPRRDARRVPQARRQAADLPRHGRSHLLGARVDRLLPASRRATTAGPRRRPAGPACSSCPA